MAALAQEKDRVDSEVRQRIESAIMKYDDAYAPATADLYTEDAVVPFREAPSGISGHEAIEKWYAVEFASSASSRLLHKLVQAYPIENDMCVITEFVHHIGGKATRGSLFARPVTGRSTWLIRIDRDTDEHPRHRASELQGSPEQLG